MNILEIVKTGNSYFGFTNGETIAKETNNDIRLFGFVLSQIQNGEDNQVQIKTKANPLSASIEGLQKTDVAFMKTDPTLKDWQLIGESESLLKEALEKTIEQLGLSEEELQQFIGRLFQQLKTSDLAGGKSEFPLADWDELYPLTEQLFLLLQCFTQLEPKTFIEPHNEKDILFLTKIAQHMEQFLQIQQQLNSPALLEKINLLEKFFAKVESLNLYDIYTKIKTDQPVQKFPFPLIPNPKYVQPLKITETVKQQLLEKNLNESLFYTANPLSQKELLTLILPRGEKPVTYQQFVNQFQSILAKGLFQKFGNIQQLTVQLHPRELGSLKIQLIQHEQGITAKIFTTTHRAKEILESQIHSLRHAFMQQNIPLERIEFQTSLPLEDNTFSQQQKEHGNSQDGKEQKESGKQDEQTSSFSEILINLEI